MHLHSSAKDVPTLDARLDLLLNLIITSPPSWLWGNKLVCEVKMAPVQLVDKVQGTSTDGFTWVEDSQRLAESAGPGTHNLPWF